MFNIKEALGSELNSDRIQEIGDFIEDLFKDPEVQKNHGEDLRMLIVGPHFDEETLKDSGVKMKYTCQEIQACLNQHGISFHPCVTKEDIVYTVNMLYCQYFPLIQDLGTAIKFAEKYIKDPSWPVEYGKPYMIWKYTKEL